MVGSRTSANLQFLVGGLLPYALKSLVDLTQVLPSRVREDEPQAAVTPESAQKPVGLRTQKLWGRIRTTPRYHHALGVIFINRAGVTGASRNGGQDTFATGTRPGKSRAFR